LKSDARVFGGRVVLCLALVTAASALQAAPTDEVVEHYRGVMITDMDRALAGAKALRERLAANDIPGAKQAWIDARVGWERSEVFTSAFIPDLDAAIDAWPDATSGFHGIEAKLFGADRADVRAGMGDAMDGLVRDLTAADKQVHDAPLTRQGLLNGLARLAYEIGDSKVDGGESRLSGTSLDDMRNNADGIALAYGTLFASALAAADAKLDAHVRSDVSKLKTLLAAKDLRSIDPEELQKASEALVLALSAAAPKLGLETPTLEGGPASTGASE
jgi:iron uptake system EfeUOB component EfeO/EfeM